MNIKRSAPVESSALDIFKSLKSMFDRFMNWLCDDSDMKETSDGGKEKETTKYFKVTPVIDDEESDKPIRLQLDIDVQEDPDGYRHVSETYTAETKEHDSKSEVYEYDLIEGDDEDDWSWPDDYQKKVNDTISKVLSELLDVDIESFGIEEIKASVKVKMQKVASSSKPSVSFTKIQSFVSVPETSSILDALRSDPGVECLVDNSSTTFDVYDLEDSLDVCPATEQLTVKYYDTISNMLAPTYDLLSCACYCAWNAHGRDADILDNECQSYIWNCRDAIDQLSRMCVRLDGCCPYPAQFSMTCPECGENPELLLQQKIRTLIDSLNQNYCNLPVADQAMILSWIQTWTHAAEYLLERKNRI